MVIDISSDEEVEFIPENDDSWHDIDSKKILKKNVRFKESVDVFDGELIDLKSEEIISVLIKKTNIKFRGLRKETLSATDDFGVETSDISSDPETVKISKKNIRTHLKERGCNKDPSSALGSCVDATCDNFNMEVVRVSAKNIHRSRKVADGGIEIDAGIRQSKLAIFSSESDSGLSSDLSEQTEKEADLQGPVQRSQETEMHEEPRTWEPASVCSVKVRSLDWTLRPRDIVELTQQFLGVLDIDFQGTQAVVFFSRRRFARMFAKAKQYRVGGGGILVVGEVVREWMYEPPLEDEGEAI